MSTLIHRLHQWAETQPQSPAQSMKRGGEWKTIPAQDFRDRVFALAMYLDSRGFTPDDSVCILSYNCPEWVHMDLAPGLLGGKTAGIYPNSTAKDIHYIVDHTQARFLAVQNKEYFQKIVGKQGEHALPATIECVFVFDGDTSVHPKAVAYETALAEGRKLAAGKQIQPYLDRMDPHRGAFLIYTSGTTGSPKGALISHDNLVYTAGLAISFWKIPPASELFSFLPLCHIAEKIQNLGVGICLNGKVSFCTAFEKVSTEIVEVQPTILLSVPRLWEKMMEGVDHKLSQATGAKAKLAAWALRVSRKFAQAKYAGKGKIGLTDVVQLKLADKLVLSKVRHALGLSRAVVCASGAAALPAHVSRWFRALQLEILEDFGQTESTGVICMTLPGVDCAGTVGKPVPGTEFRLASDGEILTKGRHVFKGYFRNDDATEETLVDGWLHTGDLGELDDRGLLKIKGRKKEIIKTSGGKMIAPLPIEDRLKASPLISQACMVGDGRKYLSMLVTLSEGVLKELQGKPGALGDGVVKDAATLADVKREVDALNSSLANFEKIKQVTVLAAEFSIESGDMTATMKMKRNVIEQNYKHLIDKMYAGGGE
ncbi:MAG: long-chain fatty acid--CoA ligase [Bacteriovoracia bacterium]